MILIVIQKLADSVFTGLDWECHSALVAQKWSRTREKQMRSHDAENRLEESVVLILKASLGYREILAHSALVVQAWESGLIPEPL